MFDLTLLPWSQIDHPRYFVVRRPGDVFDSMVLFSRTAEDSQEPTTHSLAGRFYSRDDELFKKTIYRISETGGEGKPELLQVFES